MEFEVWSDILMPIYNSIFLNISQVEFQGNSYSHDNQCISVPRSDTIRGPQIDVDIL